MLRTEDLSRRYGRRMALNNVSLAVDAGSVFGLVGPNGAGKTTLLSIIAGLRSPTAGRVHLEVDRSDVAVCPDAPEFEPWLTAHEVVALAARLAGVQPAAGAVDELLDQAGLRDAAHRVVGGFSRGMTQRLALAATIVSGPKLVILDEPCAALDPAGRVEVLDLVARLAGQSTIIFSSHILADVERVCDSVAVLDRGRLRYQGSLDTLLDSYAQPAWTIRVTGRARAIATAISTEHWVDHAIAVDSRTVQVRVTDVRAARRGLADRLATARAGLVSVEPLAADLEAVFLALTRGAAPSDENTP